MSQIIEVKVPDIGDFKNVPIIEIAVKVGDSVAAEEALMTLESDKATIDVPSPCDGIIKEITVKAADRDLPPAAPPLLFHEYFTATPAAAWARISACTNACRPRPGWAAARRTRPARCWHSTACGSCNCRAASCRP